MEKSPQIRIGIVGYGNLGKGVETALSQNPDMELKAIFTRRSPESISSPSKVVSLDDMEDFKDQIDVMILCGGSAKDLPEQSLLVSTHFNTVDSFDTHAEIPNYFKAVDQHTKKHGNLSLISTGWDPGLFSMARLLGMSILPKGKEYTFWGKGLSQGHSDAVRKVKGVKHGVQYTLPNQEAMQLVRSGENPELTVADRHKRVCYIVPEPTADTKQIENDIKEMPHYFKPYPTEVHFIDEKEFYKNHSDMPHGGTVFRSGISGNGAKQRIEFALDLESNPEFTSSVLVAFSRAVFRMSKEGKTGAISVFDVPVGLLSPKSPQDLRKDLL